MVTMRSRSCAFCCGTLETSPSHRRRSSVEASATWTLQTPHASAFGGTIRPIAVASWRDTTVTAYAGPAFVETTSQLCRGWRAERRRADNAARGFIASADRGRPVGHRRYWCWTTSSKRSAPAWSPIWSQPRACDVVQQAEAGWFVRLTSTALAEQEAPALPRPSGCDCAALHVDARWGRHHQWILTHPCGRAHSAAALEVLEARTGSQSGRFRVWNETRGFGGHRAGVTQRQLAGDI